MKFCTPQIVWHDKDPVYSIDFHHVEGEEWRLASGGTDKDIKIWKVIYQDGKIKLEFLAHLSRHTRPVNTVRFSPNGKLLATASDDAIVCIWKKSQLEAQHIFGEVEKNQENWSTVRTLRLVESSLPIINQVRHSSLGNDHILCVSLTFNLFDLLRSPERTSRLGILMSMFFLSNQNSDHH